MRILGLLCACVLVLLVYAAMADDRPQASKDFALLSDPGLTSQALSAESIARFRVTNKRLADLRKHHARGIPLDADGQPVCYTMRSYLMEREDPQSDVTRVAGYTTCQPSSSYSFKTADAPGSR